MLVSVCSLCMCAYMPVCMCVKLGSSYQEVAIGKAS